MNEFNFQKHNFDIYIACHYRDYEVDETRNLFPQLGVAGIIRYN